MNSPLVPGSKYLLDEKTEVIILKPATRSGLVYTVEILGKSVESVERGRLTTIIKSEPDEQKLLA